MKIKCFEKVKHKEVQLLQDEFDRLVPENTDMPESEQKEIGKKIVLDYYKKLNQETNDLKVKLNKEPSELPDKTEAGQAMANLYDNLISEIKNEQNENAKFSNQTSADQVQIIKSIENEGEAAELSGNAEAGESVLNRSDDIVNSTPEQEARKKGEKEVDGTVIKRQEPVTAVIGNDVEVLFSKDKKQPAKYAVIELSDLQASHNNGIKNENHFIPEAQPRDRGALEVLKNEAKNKAENLDPNQLADNNIAYFGSPIVNARGEVIQGNGRAEAIDYYYNNNKDDSKGYREMINGKAESLSLDASEVAKMKQPVLVRMADVNDEQAIILGNHTSSDLEDVKQKDADVKAAIGKLSDENLKQLSDTVSSKVSESDTLKSAIRDNAKAIINLLMDIGALRADNREQYFNQDGVTPEGIEAAYNIVKQLLFEGGPNDLSGKFNNLPFAQREAIEKTIPAIISNPELKNHVQKAIEILHDKNESGTPNFNTWAKQYDLFKGKSPVESYGKSDLALAKSIDEATSQKGISTTIKEIAVAMNGKPADMFESAKEGLPFNEAIAEKNIVFQFQEPSTEDVNDMKEVIKEMVDAGVLSLKEIQDKVATELEDDTEETRDLVTTAYHEYGKDKENTPKEITGGIIGRIGKYLAKLFGGKPSEKIYIAKDTASLIKKANELGGDVQYQKSFRDYVNIVLTSIALSSTPIQTANESVPVSTEINESDLKAKQTIKKLIDSYYAENEETAPPEVIERALKVWERVGRPEILPDSTNKNERAYADKAVLGNITNFDDLVAELAHAAQFVSKAQLDERGYATQADYDKVEYDRVGSVEYDAHKIIEPLIAAYILKGSKPVYIANDKYGLKNVLYQIKNDLNLQNESELEKYLPDTLSPAEKQGSIAGGEANARATIITGSVQAANEAAKARGEGLLSSEKLKNSEAKYLEADAKENGIWIEDNFGTPHANGFEQDVYMNPDGKKVTKVNSNVTHDTWNDLFHRIAIHNSLFPDVAYTLKGFTKHNFSPYNITNDFSELSAVFEQPLIIKGDEPIKYDEVVDELYKLGFEPAQSNDPKKDGSLPNVSVSDADSDIRFINKNTGVEISDLHGENVMRGTDGKIHFIDPIIELTQDRKDGNQIKFMKSPDGTILGFSHMGKIYLNGSELNPNSALHESGHLLLEWMKQNDTKVYNRGIELVTGSRYLDKVKANEFYQNESNKLPADKREELFKQEALAAAIGDRGAQFVTEAKKKGFTEWLNNLWEAVKNTLGLKNITAKELSELTLDEFAKRAAADILRQETEAKEALNEITDQLKNWGLSFKDAEILQGVADTDEKILNGELSREQYLRMKINLLESQQTMQGIVRKARVVFGDNYIQKLMDIADTEKDISLPTKRNLATRLKEEVAQGNKFVFDKVAMWAKKFATEASAAMNLGKPIGSVKELDNVSEPANEIMNQIGAEIKEGENIVLDAVSETTSDEILSFQQREEELLNEIADLKQQLEDLENKKNEERPNKKGKLTTNDYAEKAKAANNRLGNDKKIIIDKIKEIIKKC